MGTELALPDSTAVVVALWRASHLILDKPPYVLEDTIGLRLAYHADVLRAASFHVADDAPADAPGDGWLSEPRMVGPMQERWRASVLARSRFVEDLVVEGVGTHGVEQYVILGAGLDSFALRRADVAPRLRVFEVDEPGTQAWKRERLKEVGLGVPAHLRFAPVDFESGESWVEKIVAAGFDTRPWSAGGVAGCDAVPHEGGDAGDDAVVGGTRPGNNVGLYAHLADGAHPGGGAGVARSGRGACGFSRASLDWLLWRRRVRRDGERGGVFNRATLFGG